jgi:transmembrane sensor
MYEPFSYQVQDSAERQAGSTGMHTRQRGSLIEEAQRWERALKDAAPDERAAFAAWIKRSPQHLQAFLQHMAVETELRQLDACGEFDIEALLAKASSNVIHLNSGVSQTGPACETGSGRGKRWRLACAIAASGVLACLIFAGVLSRPRSTNYSTDTGEQRRIVLPDGSSIELNTESQIRVSFRRSFREVELLSGEALFSVRHDAARPFRVRVADKVVEDLGTQFSVYLRPDASTTVSVLDGRVRILSPEVDPNPRAPATSEGNGRKAKSQLISRSTQIGAGEEIRIGAGGRLIKRAAINATEAAAWREHRLWFDGATLSEVAAEFNRYNKRRLRVSDSAIALKKRYTATFDAYDPESFVQALRDDPTLTVQSDEDGSLIYAR